VLPVTGIDSNAFWRGFDAIVHDLAPKNAALLAERDRLQSELDRWHRKHPGPVKKPAKIPPVPRADRLPRAVPPARDADDDTNVDAELAAHGRPAARGADHQCALWR